MDLVEVVAAVGGLWGLDTTGWSVLRHGPATTIRLPACDRVVHVSRPEVGPERVIALQTARARLAESAVPTVDLVATRDGATWTSIDGRAVEVERWVEHDGRMNTWQRLRAGAGLLARVHDAWADLDLGEAGEACSWANWLPPAETASGTDDAVRRLTAWGLHDLGADVARLAELTGSHVDLPVQVVHGDFWDDNVYWLGERIVAITDLDFLGRRPRIDDLALMLHFADEQPYFDGAGHRSAATRQRELAPLVHAYAAGLRAPLLPEEIVALPVALARQPLWTFAKWMLLEPDDRLARRDALAAAGAVARALEVVAEADRWAEALVPPA